jgi:hypothetical protein
MPKTPSKKGPNKSAFIRSLPADMPAADVVAKAKAANIKLTPAFVYAIRSKSKTKGKGTRGAKRGPKPASGKQSASDFVRTQPATMKALDVVSAGAKQGIKFSTNLVYAVRAAAGRRPAGGRGGARRGRPTAAGGGHEATFRQLALDLGIARARHLIETLESKLKELIGG